ncbi:class C sortase [Blautia sp. MSJ-9]|uniref:class C sortase n=1 Tax=Blautia sp. MSJ-9 TaxID=2841511 RepID=UPI0020A1C855|nr:class C sortase [Blautia sp. MSJ-9]
MSDKKKKLRIKYIGFSLLFLVGLSILLYPMISSAWNKRRAGRLITEYSSSVTADTDKKETDSIWKNAQEYNEQLEQESVPDAFSVRDGKRDKKYESLLNFNGDGMMGSVEIPVIDENIPLYHYTTDKTLSKGAGHLFGSSLPVGGPGTHCVISAHRGLPSAKLFTDLNLLKEGDVFYLHILDRTLAYEVDQILTVLPAQTDSLGITPGKDYVTLVTCTPYAVNTHRLLVRGHRITVEEAGQIEKTESRISGFHNPNPVILTLCVIGGIVLAVIFVTIVDRLESRRFRRN